MFPYIVLFFFKQKTAYEMRISDWSSDVCSSDLSKTPQRPPELLHSITCKGSPMEDFIDNLAAQEGWTESTTKTVLAGDRKSVVSGKSVSVRVDLGGRRIIKKKRKDKEQQHIKRLYDNC